MNNKLEDFIQQNSEAFNQQMPDDAVLQRIQNQLQGKPKKKGILVPLQTLRWAAAILIILAGSTIFLILQKKPATEKTEMVSTGKQKAPVIADTKENTSQPVTTNKINTADLDNTLSNRKQVLFAKLTNMESTSNRVLAASQISRITNTDHDIVDALVKTMDSDPSTNVRLAALESLARFYREKYVRKKLVGALTKQNDPVVQIELIKLLTKMRETSILNELDKLVNDGNTMEAVKDHAYSSIFVLR